MGRWNAFWSACGKAFDSYAWIITKTIWVAIYGPFIVLVIGLFVAAMPYYFYTLARTPSWVHLYLGLVFAGVGIYRIWFWKPKDLEFEVQRGREFDRGLRERHRIAPPERSSRLDRTRTRINRGR